MSSKVLSLSHQKAVQSVHGGAVSLRVAIPSRDLQEPPSQDLLFVDSFQDGPGSSSEFLSS